MNSYHPTKSFADVSLAYEIKKKTMKEPHAIDGTTTDHTHGPWTSEYGTFVHSGMLSNGFQDKSCILYTPCWSIHLYYTLQFTSQGSSTLIGELHEREMLEAKPCV